MDILDHWTFKLLDFIVTGYLLYYYITHEIKKDKENNV